MTRYRQLLLIALVLGLSLQAHAQVEEARTAIDQREYVRAVNILSEALTTRPTSDAYFYLGIAYAHMREWARAEEVFREGAERYGEARFFNELAGTFLAANDVDSARDALLEALTLDPENAYATDLLATIDMSQGKVQSALQFWNRSGRPIVDDILHNSFLNIGHWTVSRALTFRPGGLLGYSHWRTTQLRLLETGLFSNVGLEIEPTPIPNQYNAIILTADKGNSLAGIGWDVIRGLPTKTTYLNVWDVGNSGVSFNSSYRWDARRRRGEIRMRAPLPLSGVLQVDARSVWRSEQWDIGPITRTDLGPREEFHYKATSTRLTLKHIPHYRVELGAGFEYTNRDATGDLPELATDNRNSGKLLAETAIRIADGRYRNRLYAEGFLARESILGDFDYSGGTVELNNRFLITEFRDLYFDWTLKAGTSRGALPVEDYFMLGLDSHGKNLLRGHIASTSGRYGNAPMGTDFLLANFDVERRITAIPLFNMLNVPFIVLKWELFTDVGKTFDRARIFEQDTVHVDVGGGFKFETPTQSFNLIYGRGLRDASNVFYGYVEHRW